MDKWKYFVVDLTRKEIFGPYERSRARKVARTLRAASPGEIGPEIGTNIIVLNEKQIVDKLQGK